MGKIMVEIYLPASGKSYDIRIPANCRIGEMIPLIEACMGELAEGYFVPTGDALLCDRSNGVALNINMTADEMGIVNGAKLMLI